MAASRASEHLPPQRIKRRVWPGRVLLIAALSLSLLPGTFEAARAWFATLFRAALQGDDELVRTGAARLALVVALMSALVIAARLGWNLQRSPRRLHAGPLDEFGVPAWFHAISVALALTMVTILAARHMPHAVRLLDAPPAAGDLVWRGILGRTAGLSLIFAILAAGCEEAWLRAEVRRRDLAWAKQHQHRLRANAGTPR